MMKHWMAVFSFAVGLALAGQPLRAQAADPVVQPVQVLCDTLIDVMKHAKPLGIKGRYDRMKPVVEQYFDLADMIRIVTGPKWATMSAQDHAALQGAFTHLAIAQYASNFDGYDGERFEIDPVSIPRGADRVVTTRLIGKSETVAIAYRMHQVGGGWKILDVYFKNTVSQITTQRGEYGATVQAGGAAALEKKLSTLADTLMKE